MTLLVDTIILVAAILLLAGVVSSKFSSRFGIPMLLLFLAVGMLAGEDGIGRIAFDDYGLVHAIGTLALAVILFDGGLRTEVASLRRAGAPATVLATAGVLITAGLTGAGAFFLLGLQPLQSMLLGSIVASTDAAAVFSVLRGGGLQLEPRTASTLEIESGSNDPMAVLLTLVLIGALFGDVQGATGIAAFLLRQLVLGVGIGLLVGWTGSALVNRIRLDAAGLYPVLVAVCGLLAYGGAAVLGGNGFLSVYLAGIVIGNRRIVFRRSTLLLHDGLAWIAQMVMFILLGLVATPSDLLGVAGDGLLVAGVLILVARPTAVFLTLLPFSFRWRQLAFLSWAGLKGAVPIILATYPLIYGVPDAELLFDLVFFVVLVSALTQGWSLVSVAEWLGVRGPPRSEPPVALELTSLRDVEGDIVDYTVTSESRVAGRRLRAVAFPDGAVVALITRGEQVIPPRGSTELLEGDHVFVVVRPEARKPVDGIFAGRHEERAALGLTEFPLPGRASVVALQEFYDLELDAPDETTLEELLRAQLEGPVRVDASLTLGRVRLRIREVVDGHVEWVGLSVVGPPVAGGEVAESPDGGVAGMPEGDATGRGGDDALEGSSRGG